VLFTSQHVHTIDAKQRLAIPAAIRKHIENEKIGNRFFLGPGADGHLWLYPESTFRQLAMALAEGRSPLPDDEQLAWEEMHFSQSDEVEIDKNGRIRIPEGKLEAYGLGQRIAILGINDHLVLRNAQEWEAERREKLARHAEIVRSARTSLRRKTLDGGQQGES
jgi:MraZ protein